MSEPASDDAHENMAATQLETAEMVNKLRGFARFETSEQSK